MKNSTHLVPANMHEATLAFFERIHRRIGEELQPYEMVALYIGCDVSELHELPERTYYELEIIAIRVAKWMPDFIKACETAKPKPYRVGVPKQGFERFRFWHKTEKVYPLPKSWDLHPFGSTARVHKWLEAKQPTLVSDVISLYLAPTIYGSGFTEDDREFLRQDILSRPALEVVAFFMSALKATRSSSRLWARSIGRLLNFLPTFRASKGLD